jgi:hypothetical protein
MHSQNYQSEKSQSNQKMTNALNYMAGRMEGRQDQQGDIESLNPEEINYLQAYLEQLKNKKLSSEFRNGHGVGTGINRQYTNPSFDNQLANRPWQTSDLPKPQTVTPDQFQRRPQNQFVPQRPANQSNQYSQHNQPNQSNQSSQFNPFNQPNSSNQSISSSYQPNPSSLNNATRIGKKTTNNDYYNPYEYGSKQNQLPPTYLAPYLGPYQNDPNISVPLGTDNALSSEQFPGYIRNVNIESSLMQKETTKTPGQREITEYEVNRFELLPYDPQDTRHIVWDDMPRGGRPSRNDRLELV